MKIKFSSPFRLIAAAARATYAKLFGYSVLAPGDIYLTRRDQCEECEELLPETNQCAVCTCDVDAKSLLALEQCPKKKWQRVWIKTRTV